jgi:hypothetical protein
MLSLARESETDTLDTPSALEHGNTDDSRLMFA